jgi:hypothetical protein
VSQPETEFELLILAFSLEIIPHPVIDSARVSREWCAYAHIDKGCGLSQVLAHVYGLPITDLHPHIDKPVMMRKSLLLIIESKQSVILRRH